MGMKAPSIVVCVPTYRRPRQLLALIKALGVQRGGQAFELLIGNNDSTPVLASVRAELPSSIAAHEIFVTERGVVAVRNAMIDWVLERRPAAQWIACLDDDQVPDPEWLGRLAEAGRRNDADLVGGPVHQIAEEATFWSGGSTMNDYMPATEGPVRYLDATGNLLVSTAFLRSIELPVFSPAFGRSGGEDYEFFLRARRLGAAVFWAPDAGVSEVFPLERLTLRGLATRAYATSAYQARADLVHGPAWHVLRTIARSLAVLPAVVVRTLVRRRRLNDAVAMLVRRGAGIAGSIAGLAGQRTEHYGKD